MSFSAGESVGPYRIIEQLGQGGMATVFKAYHAALDRFVALKVLHPAFTEDHTFPSRFQREARLMAKLEHPNIVPIFDYAEHDGRPYLVMKFIEGETLKARIATGRLSPAEIARVVDAVGAALSYAHQHGILHRDVKPSNVLLAREGGIYLADFGLARIAASGESTISTDMLMGTPQYISPEQAMGKKDLDEGTDIYSFGVMFYEMVVGKVPFSADTPFSIIHDHIYTPLPLPHQINPQVPPDVERVLLKALAKERGDRYRSLNDLVAAFQQAWKPAAPAQVSGVATLRAQAPTLAELPVPPAPAAPSQAAATVPALAPTARPCSGEASQPAKAFPWMWLAVGVVLLLACVVTVGGLWAARRNRRLAPVAPLDLRTAEVAQMRTPGILAAAVVPTPAGNPLKPLDLAEFAPPAPKPPDLGQSLLLVGQRSNDPEAFV